MCCQLPPHKGEFGCATVRPTCPRRRGLAYSALAAPYYVAYRAEYGVPFSSVAVRGERAHGTPVLSEDEWKAAG
ncbi:hypothetical protein GCM10010238_04140 [Streptomyces griseoviridis]|uniref:Uncharacterized protein n=1 Tax=Streptomyces griseoviridis TaxID=45398 RepID=A0A918G521_STRGD|nr:hypothetical protein GCM10010238_04140 [Streptomyces niveoruber]